MKYLLYFKFIKVVPDSGCVILMLRTYKYTYYVSGSVKAKVKVIVDVQNKGI